MPELKLGKAPARIDSRTLKLSSMLRVLPPLPAEYDLDKVLDIHDDRAFGNLEYGDCVIAGRAHMTMRFEKVEQRDDLSIQDSEVVAEYLKETGGVDSGLVMLNSLNSWRKEGWTLGGKHYDIHAYTALNWRNHGEVMAAIYMLGGVYAGALLPVSGQKEFNGGQPWAMTDGPDTGIGSWGGHAIYFMAYNPTGPICMTWGKRQQTTWAWWDKYMEECYACIDSSDNWLPNSPVDSELLEKQDAPAPQDNGYRQNNARCAAILFFVDDKKNYCIMCLSKVFSIQNIVLRLGAKITTNTRIIILRRVPPKG